MIKAVLLRNNSNHSEVITAAAKNSGLVEIVAELKLENDVLKNLRSISYDLAIINSAASDDRWMKFTKRLPNQPLIIYISPNGGLASKAFDYGIDDFVSGPPKKQRMLIAFSRMREKYLHRIGRSELRDDYYFIRERDTLQKVKADDIIMIQAFGDYVNIYSTHKKFTVHSTIKNMEARLSAEQFMRVHRSYIVNVKNVNRIVDDKIFVHDQEVPIGEAFRPELIAQLNILK